jgi:pyrimidine-specific ribonucleoside hydrolase
LVQRAFVTALIAAAAMAAAAPSSPTSASVARAVGAATGPAASTLANAQRRSVVIDSDLGGDDMMAILYLLKRPDVDIRAITVAGPGLAHCAPGVRNALGLLALVGRAGVPVACGREQPLRGRRAFPTQLRRDADERFGLALPRPEQPASARPAARVLASAVRSAPGAVSLVTLGPLTNVAEMLRREPALAGKLSTLYVMGGAIGVPGNVPGTTAEWNLYVDPYAADVVLRSKAPVTLVPLDATNDVPVTRSFHERITAAHATRESTFVYDLLNRLADVILTGDYFFWDPLAASASMDSSLVGIRRWSVAVTTTGPRAGSIRVARGGTPVRVAVSANRARFERGFLTTLNSRTNG